MAGLSIVSGIILVVQLMLFSPFNSYHGFQRQNRGSNEFKDEEIDFKETLMASLRGAQVKGVAMTNNMMINHATNRVGITEIERDHDFFAPIIIGAGQGTTGTHLFAEATCRLGFVTLHYGVGCLPENALIPYNKTNEISRQIKNSPHPLSCQVSIAPSQSHYASLLQYHKNLSRGSLSLMRKKDTDLVELKHHLLDNLEKIIVWGKQNKVGLALHDTPYPNLIPEIFQIVQKYYGGNKSNIDKMIPVKPIIILSERNAEEFVERRTRNHGSYSWICRPDIDNFMNSTVTNTANFISTTPFNFEQMNETEFEGGAFDFIGCINHANFSGVFSISNSSFSSIKRDRIFYSFTEAERMRHRHHLIDTMKNYQQNMRNEAVFSYNVFDQKNRTKVNDLADWIKLSMLDTLISEDGQATTKGADFFGFDNFFKENKFEVEVIRGHRRRHYGASYGENRSESILDVHWNNFSTNKLRMSRIHIFKMKQISSLDNKHLDCG